MTRQSPRAAGTGRRHHIADVAHHFLGDGAAGAGPSGTAVVVAAAEPLPLTAFVAAGAARAGAIRSGTPWGLLEEGNPAWSARAHLAGDPRIRLLVADGFERHEARDQGLCWHLGPASGDRLDAWTGACRLPGCVLPTVGRPVHLFWCVPADAAAALSPLGLLVRLADLLAPAHVDLVVAPRGWPVRPATAQAAGDRALARLHARSAELCGRPVRLGVVAPGMGTAAAGALVSGFLHEAVAAAGT
ncbi:MAG: hypothetical protein ABR506_12240 [Candidatus Krumholzibacteriia bacterium]